MARTRPNILGKSKSQVINFRLSPDEYEAVREACETVGAKSVSSFARFIVMFWLDSHKQRSGSLDDDTNLLTAKFSDFELTFRQYVRRWLKQQPGMERNRLES